MTNDKLWQVEDPTPDEVRERLAAVMRNMSDIAIDRQLMAVSIYRDHGRDMSHMSRKGVEKWLAALTAPLGGGR